MPRESLKLLAVGDIMPADTGLRLGFGSGSELHRRGCEFALNRLQSVLAPADLVLGNLEAPLGEVSRIPLDYRGDQFLGDPRVARLLADAGFHVLNVANNHIMQHGPERFEATVGLLRASDLGVAGLRAGSGTGSAIEPYATTIRGVRVGVLGASLRPEKYHAGPLPYARFDTADELVQAVAELRETWDLGILTLHWGAEYMSDPAPSQRQLARSLFDAGIDIILGHHAHVLQPVEQVGNKLAAYSLGNFVFDMWRRQPRRSAVLEIEWQSGRGVVGADVRAATIDRSGWPVPAGAVDAAEVRCLLERSEDSEASPSSEDERAYRKRAERAEFWNAMHNRWFFVRNLARYSSAVRRAAVSQFVGARVARSA